MSSTGTTVVHEANILMGNNPDDPIVDPDIIRLSVNTQVSIMANDLGLGPKWRRNLVSLTTSAKDYVLSASVQYNRILQVSYSSDLYPLTKINVSDLIKLRAGGTGNGGRQFIYAIDVDDSQQATLMLPFKPSQAEDLDFYVSEIPSHWDDGPGTPPTIPFSEAIMRALALRVAADVTGTLGPDRYVALALPPGIPDKWQATSDHLVRNERIMLAGLKRQKQVSRTARWL